MAIQMLKVSEIVAIPDRNYSRPNGVLHPTDQHFADLVRAIVGGWDAILSVAAIAQLSEKDVQEGLKARQFLFDSLKTVTDDLKIKIDGKQYSISPADRLVAAQEMFAPKGKLLTPRYEIVAGFRRFDVLVMVNAIRKKIEKMKPITEIPCTVDVYGSDMERRLASIRENGAKTEGVLKLTHAQKLLSAKALFPLGVRESDLRKSYSVSRGIAQKMHRICQLDAKYPGLNIVETASINLDLWNAFDKEVVKKFLDEEVKIEEIAKFVEQPNADKKNKPKMMARNKLERYRDQCGDEVIVLLCTAILNDDVDGFNKVILARQGERNKLREAAAEVVLTMCKD